MPRLLTLFSIACCLLLASCSTTNTRTQRDSQHDAVFVDDVLNNWHIAASMGDFQGYFDAMNDDSVFLGTDASERWTKDEFMGYAREPFSDGNGWTYIPSDRFIAFDDDHDTAWVDEIMTNEKYGTLRGTAVLRRIGDDWKIAHYSLTFLVPNEKAPEVVEVIADD